MYVGNERDQHAIELNTLSTNYSTSSPEAFGLGVHALWVPKTTGWGAWFGFGEQGDGIYGDGWGVTFYEYTTPTGSPKATVDLGWDYTYTVHDPLQTELKYSSDLPLREDLALYLSTPEAMRTRGLAGIQALAQKVTAAINAHQVKTCDWEPYQGGGISPACPPRPMTPSEEAAQLAWADAYFADQQQLLDNYYQEMYAAWMAAFPLDRCWP